jgi:hypothetical protein
MESTPWSQRFLLMAVGILLVIGMTLDFNTMY